VGAPWPATPKNPLLEQLRRSIRRAEENWARREGLQLISTTYVDARVLARRRSTGLPRVAPSSGRPAGRPRAQATRSSAKSGDGPSDDDGSDPPPRRLKRRRGGLRHISFAIRAFLAGVRP
jgi:hypothetical protein